MSFIMYHKSDLHEKLVVFTNWLNKIEKTRNHDLSDEWHILRSRDASFKNIQGIHRLCQNSPKWVLGGGEPTSGGAAQSPRRELGLYFRGVVDDVCAGRAITASGRSFQQCGSWSGLCSVCQRWEGGLQVKEIIVKRKGGRRALVSKTSSTQARDGLRLPQVHNH